MMKDEKDLVPIGEAAELLGVSIDTLRRWDESGEFLAIRRQPGGDRYYRKKDIEIFLSDLFRIARDWVFDDAPAASFSDSFYCPTSAVFQARLTRMQDDMIRGGNLNHLFPLLVSIAGEMGNNSYDHNLGLWPDAPGIFFGYDLNKKQIVLADRGVGILATLKRVRPTLENDEDAVRVAFTEVLSGRAPEGRGNGLKYVKEVVSEYPINLLFRTGNAELAMAGTHPDFAITATKNKFRGCLVMISY